MEKKSRQRIRYLHTADGVRLAWAEAGDGPLLVEGSNWLTHLEYDWESPVWGPCIRFFSRACPRGPLRRAGLRDDRLERRRPLLRALGRGPRGGGAHGPGRRAHGPARHLP